MNPSGRDGAPRDLFDQAWRMLNFHSKRKGETVEQTLNRVFREQLRDNWPNLHPDAPHIWEHNLVPRKEDWDPGQLACLRPKHDRADPDSPAGPIVLAEHRGIFCVVDGSNRVNIARRDGQALCVIVLKVEGRAK